MSLGRSKEKPPNPDPSETKGKRLFRHAWDYAQKIDRATKTIRHTAELFSPELQSLRKKLRDKCEQILLLPCSYRRKAEELLWKKAFYEVVQKCKQHRQALDGSSPLHLKYRHHLGAASSYLEELLQKLQGHYGFTVAGLDGSQLEDLEVDGNDMKWFKAACYRTLVCLGDLARYQLVVGGSPYTPVAYYHQAISLDPTKGAPFNQLAALAGDKNEFLDAVYYYQRRSVGNGQWSRAQTSTHLSLKDWLGTVENFTQPYDTDVCLTSPHPFEGSEANLQRLFVKNREQLDMLLARAEHTKEPAIADFTRKFLLVRFLHLQQVLSPSKRHTPAAGDLGQLCQQVLTKLEECLDFDLHLYEDTCSDRVHVILTTNQSESREDVSITTDNQACLPCDLLLKVAALSILPSHCLRLQGSTHTPAASAFALSVFSQLLHHSYRRLAYLLIHAIRAQKQHKNPTQGSPGYLGSGLETPGGSSEDIPDLDSLFESGKGMLEVVLGRAGSESNGELLEKVLLPMVNKAKPTAATGTTHGTHPTMSGALTKEPHMLAGWKPGVDSKPTATAEISQEMKADEKKAGKAKATKSKQRRLKQLMYHRRRRRSDRAASSSEGESSEDSSDSSESESDEEKRRESGGFPRSSSEESLPVLLDDGLGEDDLDMLEELSDSSSGSDGEEAQSAKQEGEKQPDTSTSVPPDSVNQPKPLEELLGSTTAPKTPEGTDIISNAPTNTTSTASSHPPRHRYSSSKRQIVLAANFNLPPPSANSTAVASPKQPLNLPVPPQHEAASPESAITDHSEHTKPSTHNISQAANTTAATPTVASVSDKSSSGPDDAMLQQLLKETHLQSAVHLVCSLVAEEGYLMILRMFAEWLQSYPVVIATCGQSSSVMWSRLAALLNFLPGQKQLIAAGLVAAEGGVSCSTALVEDVALRGFAPLIRAQEGLDFRAHTGLSKVQQAAVRIQSLHKFGQYVASAKTAPSFSWDGSRYMGPTQRSREENKWAEAEQKREGEKAQLNRSKLMKAMAHQRLQHEVATLTKTSAEQEASFFTPYLVPDANTLCSSLHIVRKLIKTKKFVIVIAKSVIETLDGMKKGRENYTAREAIKFLERELQDGNRFVRAQKASETLQSKRRKAPHQELQAWHLSCLLDCALYFNQTYAERGGSKAVVTLLLDKATLDLLDSPARQAEQPQLAGVVQQAEQSGLEIETALGFHASWQAQGQAGKS